MTTLEKRIENLEGAVQPESMPGDWREGLTPEKIAMIEECARQIVDDPVFGPRLIGAQDEAEELRVIDEWFKKEGIGCE